MIRICLILLFPTILFGQPPLDRYQSQLFNQVTETQDILFSTNVPQPNPGGGFYEFVTGLPLNVDEYNTTNVNLQMNIFEPTGDTLSQRPVVIICFGGGFLSGSKDHWSIRLLCQELAKQGYVTAAIDYRLGMNVFDSDLAQRAVYRGLQDARSAVRFFRADAFGANQFRVDPDQIFIGGHSSGAFMALHNAYLDTEIERPLSTYQWTQDGQSLDDLGCLDCAGDNQVYNGHANAIFSLAGALGFTDFIDASSDPEVVMFHSTDDGTVPYDSGGPFGSIIWLVVGSDLPDVYGSLPISIQADAVGLEYDFFSYTDRGHDVHEMNATTLYSDILPGITNWFFDRRLKPAQDTLNGPLVVCTENSIQTYMLNQGDAHFYDWSVQGGSFQNGDAIGNNVVVEWDENATEHRLSVTPYSELDARGDSILVEIDMIESDTNTILGFSSSWHDAENWSAGVAPLSCHDVELEVVGGISELFLESPAVVNRMSIVTGMRLTIQADAVLSVIQSHPFGNEALHLDGELINMGTIYVSHMSSGKEIRIAPTALLTNLGILNIGEE